MDVAQGLSEQPTQVLDIKMQKPLTALQTLREQLGDDPAKQAEWREQARIAAVMGSCPRSKASFKSGDLACPVLPQWGQSCMRTVVAQV